MSSFFKNIDRRLSDDDLRRLFEQQNAIVMDSHFVYSKPEPKGYGDHGPHYVNKDALYVNPLCIAQLCLEMAWRIHEMDVGRTVEVVVGPEKGAIQLSAMVAMFLSLIRGADVDLTVSVVESAFAEKAPKGGFELRRGYDKVVCGRQVAVVEDVLNSGGTVAETVTAIRESGGDVVTVVAICNRGGVTAEALGVSSLTALLSFDFEKYPWNKCPLCECDDVPVRTDLGHGAAFLAEMQRQP